MSVDTPDADEEDFTDISPEEQETNVNTEEPHSERSDTEEVEAFEPETLEEDDEYPLEDMPDMSLIGDIPVLLTLEVGDKEMTIAELSALRAGSVVALQHKESDPLDVKANGILIAKGEVVLAGDYYGVRILSLTKAGKNACKLMS